MSRANTGEGGEVADSPRRDSKARQRTSQRTISRRTSDPVTRDSDHQDIVAGLELPFLATVSKGRLNVSEASIPAPKSSDISAQGEVFVPPHQHRDDEDRNALHVHLEKGEEETGAAEEPSENSKDPDPQTAPRLVAGPAIANGAAHHDATGGTTTSSSSTSASSESTPAEPALEHIADSVSELKDPQPASIPEIKIHRPSGTVMAASLGTSASNGAIGPPTPLDIPVDAGAAALFAVSEATSLAPVPAQPPVNRDIVINAVPLDAPTSALPFPAPGVPFGGKGNKRKNLVRKTRGLVVRRHILNVILGRELAAIVRPRLKQAVEGSTCVPLPADGPSDLISACSRRNESKMDAKRKRMDQKIASTKQHAETEELRRCPRCRGLTRTTYLQKYHRLQLKRDKPGMGVIDRHATGIARVEPFKCKCDWKLFRRGRYGNAGGDAAGAGGQRPHLASGDEPPLPGPFGRFLSTTAR